MYSIVNETENIARAYFSAFGFKEEEIQSLMELGKKDMLKELDSLHELIQHRPSDIEAINNRLHALKGLLSQLGNHKLSNQINTLRQNLEIEKNLQIIHNILFQKEDK